MSITAFPPDSTPVYEIWMQNGPVLLLMQQVVAPDPADALAYALTLVQPSYNSLAPGGGVRHFDVALGAYVVDAEPYDFVPPPDSAL